MFWGTLYYRIIVFLGGRVNLQTIEKRGKEKNRPQALSQTTKSLAD